MKRVLWVSILFAGCSGEGTGDDVTSSEVAPYGHVGPEQAANTEKSALAGAGIDADGQPVDKYWDASNYDHRGAVRIRFKKADGGWGSCSGFLINDQTVLTAGHCTKPYAGSGTLRLYIDEPGASPRYLGEFTAQSYYFGDSSSTGDVGMVRLDSWIGSGIDTDNFVLIPQSNEDVSVGWTIQSFGYGRQEPGGSSSNDQRMAVNTIDSSETMRFGVKGGSGLACKGDSGGPAMVGTQSAWDLAYGVHSSSTPTTQPGKECALDYNAVQRKAKLSPWSDWIAWLLENDSGSDFECANWTTPFGQKSKWCWQLK